MSTRSYSRWIFLLSLATLMFFSASEGVRFISLPCWEKCTRTSIKKPIQECFKQVPRHGCQGGYVVKDKVGYIYCINETSPWINDKIIKGELQCHPDIRPAK